MSVFKQDDGHGHSITYLNTGGCTTCTFNKPEAVATQIRELPNIKCRPNDIFICAPVKSGTHWVWEIISMMLLGKAETIPKSKISNMLEAASCDLLESIPSPRILNTHMHYNRLPKEAKELGCKIVYVLRNPKDVAVSLYNHTKGISFYEYDGEWKHFLPLFLEGKTENSWFEYATDWENIMTSNDSLPIHLVYFEDLKEESLEEVYRLGKFLGIDNKDGLFEAITEKCEFSNMARDKQQFFVSRDTVFKGGFSTYRKGEIGDWKNWFTVAQSEMFDHVYDDKMKQSKLKFKYSKKRQ